MNYDEYEINEEDWLVAEETAKPLTENLPKIVAEFQADAAKVSHYNEIPAAMSFFTILGQISKEFVTIPTGRNREDSRIHFCWIQTSGTGKSTLWNFVGPVAKRTFERINNVGTHPHLISPVDGHAMPRRFDIFGVTDYTDSVLLGTFNEDIDEDGNKSLERVSGLLEGSGLAHWDEFEYSGIFKQSQHKENSIVYLNTLMNTLAGESWVISKALTKFGGEIMHCYSERSVLAMTYPPNNLNNVIAEKGVLQRMVMYVVDVPDGVQHKMRLEQLSKVGTIEEVNQPIDKYVNALVEIYNMLKEHHEEMGGDSTKTIRFAEGFNANLILEYKNMRAELSKCRKEVADLASNFTTRLMVNLTKMSILVCIARSLNIKDKNDRFLATGQHVREAALIMRKCYISLVSWLEQSLKVRKASIAEKSLEPQFMSIYKESEKDNEGFVHKSKFLLGIIEKTGKSKAQIYRHFKQIEHKFDEKTHGKYKYIRLIGDDVK